LGNLKTALKFRLSQIAFLIQIWVSLIMSSCSPQSSIIGSTSVESLDPLSHPFVSAIAHVKTNVLQAFDCEVAKKQLCYHTRDHIEGVQRRAQQIFQVVYPDSHLSEASTRLSLLLDLCAVAHDMVQIFTPQTELHTSRRRAAGISETATIESLFTYISDANSLTSPLVASAQFTENDLQIIREAIAATICDYDPIEQAIYQPALYQQEPTISPVARILALADIGSLAMEGIEAYNLEGRLLFLEENPDIGVLFNQGKLDTLASDDFVLYENIRQRLLRRARFQVNFAKSRLKRLPQELEGFSAEVTENLIQEVFQHLTPATIKMIEMSTPTAADVSLETLIDFFDLKAISVVLTS
jgi:hypothetical protein